jgi:hypothetical protein
LRHPLIWEDVNRAKPCYQCFQTFLVFITHRREFRS